MTEKKALIQAGQRGLQLKTFDDYWRMATAIAASNICPRSLAKPEQILVALQFGAELGLSPMQSMATVMVVNGRAVLWGDGMLAVAQSSGLLEDIHEECSGDVTKPATLCATCSVKRKGRPSPVVVKFSWADATQAGLSGKDTYKQYPARMLKARARAFALRDAFPDVLTGIVSDVEAHDMPAPDSPAVFAPGAEQPPDDLEALLLADSVETSDVEHAPPNDDELARAGLLFSTSENTGQ